MVAGSVAVRVEAVRVAPDTLHYLRSAAKEAIAVMVASGALGCGQCPVARSVTSSLPGIRACTNAPTSGGAIVSSAHSATNVGTVTWERSARLSDRNGRQNPDHGADRLPDEHHRSEIELWADLQDVIGVAVQRGVPLPAPRREVRSAGSHMVEQYDREVLGQRGCHQPAHVLVTAEAVRQHHHRPPGAPPLPSRDLPRTSISAVFPPLTPGDGFRAAGDAGEA